MTQESFIKLLEHPADLSAISFEELKTLALAYPYTQNLHVLLALKAKAVKHPDAEKLKVAAASHTLSRKRLFALLEPNAVLQVAPVKVQAEPVLELKPIEDILKVLQAKAPVQIEAPVDKEYKAMEVPIDQVVKPIEEPVLKPEPDVQSSLEPSVPQAPKPELEVNDAGTWLQLFSLPPLSGSERKAEKSVKKKNIEKVESRETTEKVAVAQRLAEKSVAENQEILSETLAGLYARQGYVDKAIKMYEKLSLHFPEKSAYFAARIEKLKK